jgi:hypothetical protein
MLPAVTMSLDVDEIERRGHALFDALDDEMAHAIERAGEIIAEEARQNHAFTNRTGDLEASIRSIPPVGRFLDGTLRGGVVADMPYASYVEGSDDGLPMVRRRRARSSSPRSSRSSLNWTTRSKPLPIVRPSALGSGDRGAHPRGRSRHLRPAQVARDRWQCETGRPVRERERKITADEILAVCAGNTPALLLMQDRGTVSDTVRTASGAGVESVDRVDWIVLGITEDTRQVDDALTGSTGLTGVYQMQDGVYQQLNALKIPGLWQTTRVHSRGHSWGLVVPGTVYVTVMRFSTDVELPVVPITDTSTTMSEMDLNLNIGGETAPPGKPFVTVKVDTITP